MRNREINMKRTYAFFDVVGVKDAFRQGSAADVLGKFWTAVDAWTNSGAGGAGPMQIAGQNAVQVPDAYVTTFSDSAILHTEPELEISEFWKLVDGLQEAINRVMWSAFLSTGLVILIAGFVGTALARPVTRRIKILHKSSGKAMRGNLDAQTAPMLKKKLSFLKTSPTASATSNTSETPSTSCLDKDYQPLRQELTANISLPRP